MKLTLLKRFCIEKCALVFQVGIIGGSGLTNPDILKDKTDKFVDTPYGKVICMQQYLSTVHISKTAQINYIKFDLLTGNNSTDILL